MRAQRAQHRRLAHARQRGNGAAQCFVLCAPAQPVGPQRPQRAPRKQGIAAVPGLRRGGGRPGLQRAAR
eukprot:246993-Chlamydomonas_euryale.AAC.1